MTEIVFDESNAKLQIHVEDWEAAINAGADILVANGVVEPSYTEGIISGIKEYGPYIVIAPGIAIPHARPELGAVKMGYSLITLDTPVCFDEASGPVNVLITFAATDNDKHIDLLRMIVTLINDGLIAKIAEAKTIGELKQIMKSADVL